jgi:hypothetical protein
MGIEPTSEAWEASILPLYDARSERRFLDYTQRNETQYRVAVRLGEFPNANYDYIFFLFS